MRKNVIDAFETLWDAADATTDELDKVEKLASVIMTEEEFIYWTDGSDKDGNAVINQIAMPDEDAFGEPLNPTDQINESLGYDADVSDSSQYCRHGTFIGSWWGPDYMCYRCEAGED